MFETRAERGGMVVIFVRAVKRHLPVAIVATTLCVGRQMEKVLGRTSGSGAADGSAQHCNHVHTLRPKM